MDQKLMMCRWQMGCFFVFPSLENVYKKNWEETGVVWCCRAQSCTGWKVFWSVCLNLVDRTRPYLQRRSLSCVYVWAMLFILSWISPLLSRACHGFVCCSTKRVVGSCRPKVSDSDIDANPNDLLPWTAMCMGSYLVDFTCTWPSIHNFASTFHLWRHIDKHT